MFYRIRNYLGHLLIGDQVKSLKAELQATKDLAKRLAQKYQPHSEHPSIDKKDNKRAFEDQCDIHSALGVPYKIPAGQYWVTPTITIGSNLKIVGENEL